MADRDKDGDGDRRRAKTVDRPNNAKALTVVRKAGKSIAGRSNVAGRTVEADRGGSVEPLSPWTRGRGPSFPSWG